MGLPVVFGVLWLGGPALLAFGVAVALLGTLEVRRLVAPFGRTHAVVAGPGALAFLISAWRGDFMPVGVLAAVVALGFLWSGLRRSAGTARDWALTLAVSLYPAALLSYGLAFHGLEGGREWLVAAVALTFASDSSAYFVGRAIGRRRLAPRISPGKTWEGAVGGLIGCMAAGVVLAAALDLPLSPLGAAGVGAGASLLAQVGDLAESALKRAAGAGEAGRLLPGHGGILDRLDSIVLVLPAAYYWVVWAI